MIASFRCALLFASLFACGCAEREGQAPAGHALLGEQEGVVHWTRGGDARGAGRLRIGPADLALWTLEGAEVIAVGDDALELRCQPGARITCPAGFALEAAAFDQFTLTLSTEAEVGVRIGVQVRCPRGRIHRQLHFPGAARRTLYLDLDRFVSWRGRADRLSLEVRVERETVLRLHELTFEGQGLRLAAQGHGRAEVRRGAEFRPALYSTLPARCELALPAREGARVHLGVAALGGQGEVTFRLALRDGAGERTLASHVARDGDPWRDVTVPLAGPLSGEAALVLEATGDADGEQLALWSDPILRWGRASLPDVHLYLVDTLRADSTQPYGAEGVATPNVAALAAEGVVFERCVAQSNWTKPSLTSLMTSTYLAEHGVSASRLEVPPNLPTLAEVLRARGYRTGSFITNRIAGHATGLQRGFSTLFDTLLVATPELDPYRSLPAAVLPWIAAHRDEPLFVYVHTLEPHYPYEPPPELRLASDYAGPVDGHNFVSTARTPEDVRHVRQLYAGEVQLMDRSLGRYVQGLRELGRFDGALFVLTSDHGEAFLEHGEWRHRAGLFHHQVDVPLVLRLPGGARGGTRVEELVRSVDVAPSVLAAVGIAPPETMRGQDLFGADRTTPGFPLPGALSEHTEDKPLRWSGAYRTARWTVELAESAGGQETARAFDRERDPGETSALVPPYPAEVARLLDTLREWRATRLDRTPPEQRVHGLGYLDELRALGYLDDEEGEEH